MCDVNYFFFHYLKQKTSEEKPYIPPAQNVMLFMILKNKNF